MAGKEKKNVVVTLESHVDVENVVRELKKKGFDLIERMTVIPCLLGEYAGDDEKLLKDVDGVMDASPEETSQSQ